MSANLPPPVLEGDRVGIAALSGPVEPADLERGVERLRELGFDPVVAANAGERRGLFAGDDAERLAGFHRLAADPEIKAIFFARGGHGALRLMPDLDWELLARHPRAYVGYSDVTLFLNQVVARLGTVAFHGPMVAIDLAREVGSAERESLLAALRGELPLELEVELLGGPEVDVSGPLVGGCLSLLTAGLGTAHGVDPAGAILFWEDVQEPLYRIDRMLTQLRLSGTLDRIRGMVVGRFDRIPTDSAKVELDDILRELESVFDWPIAVGCASGHCEPNMTLGLGLEARLRSVGGRLTLDRAR